MPRKICDKFVAKIVKAHAKDKILEDEQKTIVQNYYKNSLYIRILAFQVLYRSLSLSVTEEGKKLYKEFFYTDFNDKSLKNLKDKIDRLKLQQEVEAPDTESAEDTKFDFDLYISGLQVVLDFKDADSLFQLYLYQLPIYEKRAKLKIETENNSRK